jgi:hypothetical protein
VPVAAGDTNKGGWCNGRSEVRFNDPDGEMSGGVLALGGYCLGPATSVASGHTFRNAVEADIVVAKQHQGKSYWTRCNLAEILTHEKGHTIGAGHSEVSDATMAPIAHFDGRCASLKADDIALARYVYPGVATSPAPSARPTPSSASTPRPSASATPPTSPSTPSTPVPGVQVSGSQDQSRIVIEVAGLADRTSVRFICDDCQQKRVSRPVTKGVARAALRVKGAGAYLVRIEVRGKEVARTTVTVR